MLTEVAQVHNRVHPRLHEDEITDDLVKVDVVVQRQDGPDPQLAHDCDGVAQHEDEDQHGVVQQDSTCERGTLSSSSPVASTSSSPSPSRSSTIWRPHHIGMRPACPHTGRVCSLGRTWTSAGNASAAPAFAATALSFHLPEASVHPRRRRWWRRPRLIPFLAAHTHSLLKWRTLFSRARAKRRRPPALLYLTDYRNLWPRDSVASGQASGASQPGMKSEIDSEGPV